MKTYVVVDASNPEDRTYVFLFQTSSEIEEYCYGFGGKYVVTNPNHLEILKYFGIKIRPLKGDEYISISLYRHNFPTFEFKNEKS